MRKPAFVLPGSPTRRPVSRAAGFTLLEVLVAIVVLSFGVLGVVGLQAAALKANNETRYQSTAVAMARELADLMRGNKNLAVLTSGNPYVGNYTAASIASMTNPGCAPCTSPTQVAQAHMRDWVSRVNAVLPGFRARVCVDSDPYDEGGKPRWDCTGSGGIVVVKIGWTRNAVGAASAAAEQGGTAAPLVVLPLIAGSST